jgi:hypothetical protein
MNVAILAILRATREREQASSPYRDERPSSSFNERAAVQMPTTGDYLQTMVAAKEIASLPERLESGEITAKEAAKLMDADISLLLDLAGLEDSMNARTKEHLLFRPGTVTIEGQTFETHPFAGYLVEAINMGVPPGDPLFTKETLAALQLDIIRGSVDETLNGESPSRLPVIIKSRSGVTGVYDESLHTGENSFVVLNDDRPEELKVQIENAGYYGKFNLYPPYDERIGLVMGLDEHTYNQKVYEGNIGRTQENLAALEKITGDRWKRPDNLGSAHIHAQSAIILFDSAVESLKRLEPGLSDDAYAKRVMAELKIDKLPQDFAPQAVSAYKNDIVEDLNDDIRGTAAMFSGCSSADEIRDKGFQVDYALQSLNTRISAMGPYRHIPYEAQFEGELLEQIQDRAKELGAVVAEGDWRLSLRALDGNVPVCDPLEKSAVKAPGMSN